MNKVKVGDKVKVHYSGHLLDGTEFDNSRTRNEGVEPIEFTIGDGKLLKGFNDAVVGLEVGEKVKVTLKEEEAYGKYTPEAILKVKKTDFPPDMEFVLNTFVQGSSGTGCDLGRFHLGKWG